MSCRSDRPNKNEKEPMVFDKVKWTIKDDDDYVYRELMLDDVIYNDTIRELDKNQLIELLGEPDYERDTHMYYRIKDVGIGSWSLKTKTMVIKLNPDSTVEWIKTHG